MVQGRNAAAVVLAGALQADARLRARALGQLAGIPTTRWPVNAARPRTARAAAHDASSADPRRNG
ncbi:MAG: hypothetical protein QOI35_350 [Cryptosporangiaceae bacterium]|nr:hypothetical protein [Cryptosporangiaceae bacterium]MDQ1651150.1 hypothetical protein [Cryptosporangiaceae bacterium]